MTGDIAHPCDEQWSKELATLTTLAAQILNENQDRIDGLVRSLLKVYEELQIWMRCFSDAIKLR